MGIIDKIRYEAKPSYKAPKPTESELRKRQTPESMAAAREYEHKQRQLNEAKRAQQSERVKQYLRRTAYRALSNRGQRVRLPNAPRAVEAGSREDRYQGFTGLKSGHWGSGSRDEAFNGFAGFSGFGTDGRKKK